MAPSRSNMTDEDSLNSQYISHSLSSLSRAKSTSNLIVRTYKQATQLYLTKRFKESWETLEPIISPIPRAQENGHHSSTHDASSNGHSDVSSRNAAAPVAQSARGTRTKVWVFYLSLLNSIVELGAEEGKLIFGAKWRELALKVRDGSVWAEIAQRGYGGNEGEVDADVVVNLATLLLAHMQDQRLNQQRLETYLATSDAGPNGSLSLTQDGMSTPMSTSSASSPRSLATRLKILELYTLHVLPANNEWAYAREFLEINDMLDDERREAFLAALENLREENDGSAKRQRELEEQRDREMEQQRRDKEEEERRKAEAARKEEEEKRRTAELEKQKAAKALNGTASSIPKPAPPKPMSTSGSASHVASTRPSKAQNKAPPSPPPNFYRRASSMLMNFQHMVVQAGQSLNAVAILRLLMFVLAFLLIIARRDLRLKVRRALEDGWFKVRQTVGMGVKVSYI